MCTSDALAFTAARRMSLIIVASGMRICLTSIADRSHPQIAFSVTRIISSTVVSPFMTF